MAEFEPVSETQLDDASGGVSGFSRHNHRVRETAVASMVQETAQQRVERALESKTRVAGEQLALEQGDLVDFWRKPATKDESGWRGPARVVEPPGRNTDASTPAATVRWQGRDLQVRTQDIRRALIYCVMLVFASWGGKANNHGDPLWVIAAFVDGLMKGQTVRI